MRRKIDIKLIADKAKRHTTFAKRRKGLAKKLEEYCRKSGSTALLLAFSAAGNLYLFGHPEVKAVLNRYGAAAAADERVHDHAPATEAERRIGDAVGSGRWEEAARGLGLLELQDLLAMLENLKRRVEEMKPAAAAAQETRRRN